MPTVPFADAELHGAVSLQSQPVRITSQRSACDLWATVSSKEILELGPDGEHSDSFGSIPEAAEEELQMHTYFFMGSLEAGGGGATTLKSFHGQK